MSKLANSKLALFGGPRSIPQDFRVHNPIGFKERCAADRVLRTGVLSRYLGTWHPDFFGGLEVKTFEENCAKFFKSKHAIAVNSWTSGLIAAVGAIGIEPGDEIITSPWTMSATAMAILHWNAIPIFADIDPYTFNLNPTLVESQISDRTKAILAVDIFGQLSNLPKLRKIADRYGLKIISDGAQSPSAKIDDKFAHELIDISGISLNYHKHIHTGEGGVILTNDDELCFRMQLIRNHAESVVSGAGIENLSNMVGFNFRMGELEAAIGTQQLKKLNSITEKLEENANYLTYMLSDLPGLRTPEYSQDFKNVFYAYPLVLDSELIKTSRASIVSALRAEGVPNLGEGYQNIHLLPVFQTKTAYGQSRLPWSLGNREINYDKGICPVAEELHENTYIGFGISGLKLRKKDIQNIAGAFQKVWSCLDKLPDKVGKIS